MASLMWADWLFGGMLVLIIGSAVAVFVAIGRSPGGWSAFTKGCLDAMDRQAQHKRNCDHCKHGGWPF